MIGATLKRPEFTMERLRNLALGLIVVLNALATVTAFGESYFGLYRWAFEHGVTGFWAAVWPLMVDLITLVAEAGLFVAHYDKWKWRHKVWLWFVMFTALGVSTGGNTGHVHSTDWLSHLTAALPPVALMFTMTVGFGVMKRTFMNKPALVTQAARKMPAEEPSGHSDRLERTPERVHVGTQPWITNPALAASHKRPERPSAPETEVPATVAEKPAPAIPDPSESPDATRIQPGFKVNEKSFTMPRDTREGLTLPQKRVRDMYDVDPDISVNAIATALGISWATAKKYLEATKKARGTGQ